MYLICMSAIYLAWTRKIYETTFHLNDLKFFFHAIIIRVLVCRQVENFGFVVQVCEVYEMKKT